MTTTITLPDKDALITARAVVLKSLKPTPLINWPLLSTRLGTQVLVKHENHLPTGAFKVRGGVNFVHNLLSTHPDCAGIVGATRGNHGQSLGFAAHANRLACTIVVPHGNNPEKNDAMRGYGVNLIEHGADFQDALKAAEDIAARNGITFVPSYHADLVAGVASYGLELFEDAGDNLDAVVVPIGLGSGFSGIVAAREALGRTVPIYGVVSDGAPAYALSFTAGKEVTHNAATVADGVACRVPDADGLQAVITHAEDVLTVPEAAITEAMSYLLTDTHNLAEGAGAIAIAAVASYPEKFEGKRVAAVLSGGNVNTAYLKTLLG